MSTASLGKLNEYAGRREDPKDPRAIDETLLWSPLVVHCLTIAGSRVYNKWMSRFSGSNFVRTEAVACASSNRREARNMNLDSRLFRNWKINRSWSWKHPWPYYKINSKYEIVSCKNVLVNYFILSMGRMVTIVSIRRESSNEETHFKISVILYIWDSSFFFRSHWLMIFNHS